MIHLRTVKRFCKEFENIENYQEAISSPEKYDCHHRLEETGLSRKDLIDKDMYYNRPASELIFLTHRGHASLHNKGKKYRSGAIHSIETKEKMSKNHADVSGNKNPNYKHICPALLQMMYYEQGKSMQQIARELGYDKDTIKRHLTAVDEK